MVATTIHAPAATPAFLTAIFSALGNAARFTGHFVVALLSVIFLGSGTDH